MHPSLRTPVLALLAACLGITTLGAQEAQEEVFGLHSLGDQTFTFTVGPIVPLRLRSLEPIGTSAGTVHASNLSPGGTLSLQWSSFINGHVSVGVEAGVAFAWDIIGNSFLAAPILLRGAYTLANCPWEFPVELGLGMTFLKLVENYSFAFVAQPAVGFLWKFSSDWSFGSRLAYRLSYEPAFGDKTEEMRIFAGVIDLTFRAVYNF